ncbi:hypothetical protein ABID59_003534 [Bradyrhizobium sp. S3.3.6]
MWDITCLRRTLQIGPMQVPAAVAPHMAFIMIASLPYPLGSFVTDSSG